MAYLKLSGKLNLTGTLKLATTGGDKVLVGEDEVLVKGAQGNGIPVILLPPPASLIDKDPKVKVVRSFNSGVTANGKAIVALGICMQGSCPTWPGMLLLSVKNTGPVAINQVAINVKGDLGITLVNGGSVTFNENSGQESE